LDGLSVNGSAPVLGALARLLAASVEAAPEYARARLAQELRAVMADLAERQRQADQEAEQERWRADLRQWAR
jgi:hypothetical protein